MSDSSVTLLTNDCVAVCIVHTFRHASPDVYTCQGVSCGSWRADLKSVKEGMHECVYLRNVAVPPWLCVAVCV